MSAVSSETGTDTGHRQALIPVPGALVLGVTAVRRHDIGAHRAWMMRAYALSLGAGTQVVTEGLGEAVVTPALDK